MAGLLSAPERGPPFMLPRVASLGAHGKLYGADELIHGGHAPSLQLAVHLHGALPVTICL